MPAVAFFARLTADNVIVGIDEAVKYREVLQNIGGGYNISSGHFCAPYSGIYTISASLMSETNNAVHLSIVWNGGGTAWLYSHNVNFPLASQTLNLYLQQGDEVWVRNVNGVPRRLHGGPYNTFSAALINTLSLPIY